MAEEKGGPESLLSRAKALEKEYDWLGAADSYGSELEALPKDDLLGIGRVQEEAAHALFRAAMQAENIEEFGGRLRKSEMQYENAKRSYVKAISPASSARINRCEAMIAYLGFWQISDVITKKKAVNEAWSLARKAMDGFGENESFELARTYNELFLSSFLSIYFSDDQQARTTILREAIGYGEKVAALLSDTESRDELVRVLVITSECLVALNGLRALSSEEFDSNHEKAAQHWRRAAELSEETALEQKASADLIVGLGEILWKDFEQLAKKQLEYVKKTRDRLAIGATLGILAFYNTWSSYGKDDPEEVNALLEEASRYVEEGKREFGRIGFVTPNNFGGIWLSSPSQWWYHRAKFLLETDLKKKREWAKKSLEAAMSESVLAEKSGYPGFADSSNWALGTTMTGLAQTETNKKDKAKLLEDAIGHLKESLRVSYLFESGDSWSLGSLCCLLAETELEFAETTDDIESRKASLDTSISHMKEGLGLYTTYESIPSLADLLDEAALTIVAERWRVFGRVLRRSHTLSNDRETLVSSAAAFEKAAEFDEKADLPSRVAESLWEAARTFDDLGEHLKASERFGEASQQYEKAANKIKSLSLLYKDQSLYMKAWSEIEKARYHHARQDPASAKEHYNRAAELLESTGKWSLLSTNYFAWAQVEDAEDLSQRERCKESIDAFGEAARLFKDSESKMHEQSFRIESTEERQLVEMLIDAADHRQGLCKARIALEEARSLDKEGKLGSASEKYGLVAEMFAKIKQGLTADQDQKEIELIITLSKAWKAMAKAEAESSPELYEEAAHLFDEAKNLSPGDRAKNMALGHSRLCMALGAGARYADTSDSALHTAAARNLESAAKYYLKADLQSAAEYAKASKLLFDSYAYVNRASSEEDQEKKTKLYTMAEKVLQASVSSYEKAGQPGRKEQVLKILAKVKEDRELAMSLAEVFLAPDIVSTTMAFSSPAPTHETAVGLDRFEHADVQATMIAKPKELHVGQELSLEIELVNAGRGPAQLTKVEGTVPKGFVIVQEPEKYRMEDSQINLRGRRLDALKTEDVRLVLKSTAKGNFTLKPRIIYLDESGTFKSCEPVPIEVSVREMGISGWIKGT
jgi:hypothetical protein